MHPIPLDSARISDARVPIVLLVDDPAPLVHVYRCHWQDVHQRPPETEDGRPLVEEIPNGFAERFAEVIARWGMRGKFSIVPGLGGRGDLVTGLSGGRLDEISQWLELAKSRIAPYLDLCPEGITHNLTVDLDTGEFLPLGESAWSQVQTEETLTPYLIRSLEMLRAVGIEATGVTSPWVFGLRSEPAYQRAIASAQKAVYGLERSWYFLHMLHDSPGSRPTLALESPPTALVSIPSTVDDFFWRTIDSPRSDRGFVQRLADRFLTRGGRGGAIARVLRAGGWPILLSHWQSLFSNGLETGLGVLDEVGRRVQERLTDQVVWCSASEVMERTIAARGQ